MSGTGQTAGETSVTIVPSESQILQVVPSVNLQMCNNDIVPASISVATVHGSLPIKGDIENQESQEELTGDGDGSPQVETGHYITVTADGSSEDVSHSYVQYVEGSGEQTIYTTTNGQMYPVYAVGESGAMYTPAPTHYYNPANSTSVAYAPVTSNAAAAAAAAALASAGQIQISTTSGSGGAATTTYLIQQGVDPDATIIARASPQTVTADVTYLVNTAGSSGSAGSGEEAATSQPPNIVHATRVSPTTVQWLLENYETAEGVSLPRFTLYNHYLRHCYDNKLDPVNAASFGKLIRSVFLGLRTRRLGTRGNSKYHYYGIRVKASSVLNQIMTSDEVGGGGGGGSRCSGNNSKRGRISCSSNKDPDSSLPPSANQEFLGDCTNAIPDFPEIELPSGSSLPGASTLEDIDTFRSIYREHCEAFLDAIVNLEFGTVESLWREFWRAQSNNNDECEEEKYLSKTKLLLLCKLRPIQEFVKKVDFQFYQNLVLVLIPDVLRPIPSSLTQVIRNFAKGLESWLTCAMQGCPADIVEVKVSAVCAFAQTLRRYTSLNHLAQAARAVLQNSVQINQMLTDLNRVDFHNVQEQAAWVCQCDSALVARLEADFKSTLQQGNSLEQWAAWLKAVVSTVLKPYQGRPDFTKAARQLLLKWSFYSSMVIRDLTLRSAASFGSFHLIRLLYDEYLFYLIEHQVALATGETPIAVMGERNSGCSDCSPPNHDIMNGSGDHILEHSPTSKRIKLS